MTSTSGDAEIGRAVSSDRYETLSKEVVATPKKDGPAKPRRKGPQRQAK